MKPLYTEVFTLKISSTQKRTLEKLKSRNIKVSDFVRKAIAEKIKRDYENLKETPKDASDFADKILSFDTIF